MRTIGAAGLNLIKQFEGCKLAAYQDVAGIWTIGYGHIRGITGGMTITQAQADQFLLDDLATFTTFLVNAVGQAATGNNQFDAMTALCFNIGTGNFRSSSVLRDHRAGNFAQAADDFLKWDKATIDGQLQEVAGLKRRREAERQLYLTP